VQYCLHHAGSGLRLLPPRSVASSSHGDSTHVATFHKHASERGPRSGYIATSNDGGMGPWCFAGWPSVFRGNQGPPTAEGYEAMPKLGTTLCAHDALLESALAPQEKAATGERRAAAEFPPPPARSFLDASFCGSVNVKPCLIMHRSGSPPSSLRASSLSVCCCRPLPPPQGSMPGRIGPTREYGTTITRTPTSRLTATRA
jgi:hypothetical protein